MKKQSYIGFGLMCSLVYFSGYLTRYDLTVSLTEIVRSLSISNHEASAAVTGIFITYGAGQLLSGALGDRYSPHGLIFIGLTGSAACNLAVILTHTQPVIVAAWCINGLFQALLWPPLMRAMVERMTTEQYRRATLWVSVSGNLATIFLYLLAPLCIRLLSWRLTFAIAIATTGLTALLWYTQYRKYPVRPPDPDVTAPAAPDRPAVRPMRLAAAGLIPISCAAILQGMLRDGVQTWVPAYVADQFHLDSASSILTAVVLPIFSILSLAAATQLLRICSNEMTASAICFGLGTLFAAMLAFLPASLPAALLEMALLTGSMHGINLILTARIPVRFRETGRVSAVSGMLNAFVYVGSAASSYGIALLSDRFGWRFTVISWVGIAAVGTLCCLCAHLTESPPRTP